MIVRLMGDAQYRVDDALREDLQTLDEQAAEALEREDEAAMDGYLDEMWKLVQERGELVPFDDLHPSDALIPPSDLSLEEREPEEADVLLAAGQVGDEPVLGEELASLLEAEVARRDEGVGGVEVLGGE